MQIMFQKRYDSFRFHASQHRFTVILHYYSDNGNGNQPLIFKMELLSPQILQALPARQVLVYGPLAQGPALFQPLSGL